VDFSKGSPCRILRVAAALRLGVSLAANDFELSMGWIVALQQVEKEEAQKRAGWRLAR